MPGNVLNVGVIPLRLQLPELHRLRLAQGNAAFEVLTLAFSPALGDKLPFIERLKLRQCRCLFGTLVFTDSRDPCKAQREARAVLRASLYFIVGDFNDDLWLHCHRIAVVGELLAL